MKQILLVLIAIALAPSAARAQALPDNIEPARSQTSDWNRVRELANGDEIVVARAGRHNIHCEFSGATDASLFCVYSSHYAGVREIQINRADVVQIRRDQTKRNRNICVGVAAVTGGVLAGVRTSNNESAGARVFLGVVGGGLAGLISFPVASVIAQVIPGSLVYRQPRARHAPEPVPLAPVPAPIGSQYKETAP